MFTSNNKPECEGVRWTDAEVRYLVHRFTRGDDSKAIAYDLLRSKSEVVLMGMALGLFTVERAA